MDFDIIIIGGSYAGLSAALQAARARRKVLVVDAGKRRNRFAAHSHGFLTHDGADPAAVAALGKAQVLAYPTVTWREGIVDGAEQIGGGFAVLVGGETIRARRLILAAGVTDELPDIPGLMERWGQSVFHCPYCHGYELDMGRIGILGTNANAAHLGMLLPDWGQVTLLLDETIALEDEQVAKLAKRGVVLERRAIAGLEGVADVRLADGTLLGFDGLFATPRMVPSDRLVEQLGLATEEVPMGVLVRTDMMKETNVPGVFACGDIALMGGGSVAMSVGGGAMAGAAAHQSLVFRE